MSQQYTLNSTDYKLWFKNFLRFSAPSLLVALGAYQSGINWRYCVGMGVSSLLTALIDLTRKWLAEG